MLFFRRRDTAASRESPLSDQERCIHACLFFAFIILGVTVALFYFGATNKGPGDQRLYYYIGGGVSLALLLLIILCTIIYVRRFYGYSPSSTSAARHDAMTSSLQHDNARYSNCHP